MLRNDEVQGAADRFIGSITKKSSSALVPNSNRSLPIREDDRIRSLFHKQSEQFLIHIHHRCPPHQNTDFRHEGFPGTAWFPTGSPPGKSGWPSSDSSSRRCQRSSPPNSRQHEPAL